MSGPSPEEEFEVRVEVLKDDVERALRDLAQYLEAGEVLAYVERIAERMHEELAGQ